MSHRKNIVIKSKMKETDINMNTNKYKHKENNYRINKQAKYVAIAT